MSSTFDAYVNRLSWPTMPGIVESYSLKEVSLNVCFLLLAVVASGTVWNIVYNIFIHKLKDYPGPKLAGATRLYELYFDIIKKPFGQYIFEVERLHKVYGPIVRINPNEIHINDPEFLNTLYSVGKRRDKDPNHIQMFGTPLSLFGSELHDVHKARRVAINPFFSKASVTRLEPIIQQRVKQMCDRYSDYICSQRPVALRDAFVAMTIDIVTEYSFGEPARALDGHDFSPSWERMMGGVTEPVPISKSLPGIVQLLQKLPLGLIRRIDPLMGSFYDYMNLIRHQVQKVMSEELTTPVKIRTQTEKTDRPTIFHELLQSSLPNHEKTEDRLTQEGFGFISAASETGSVALSTTMYHILRHPGLVQRLRDELKPLMPDPSVLANWRDLEKLPLLTAVVKEGLRISSPICSRLPLVAHEPLQYKSWTIPPNTSISMSPRDALFDPIVYPSPQKFLPERWLSPKTDPESRAMQNAFVPFNRGPRMCLGYHLAYANIYHSIAALISRFELDVVDTVQSRDVDLVRDHFVAKPVRGSRGVRVRVSREYGL